MDFMRLVEPMCHDLRSAYRTLRGSPAIAAATVFSLALGIGANTAIFSVANALMLEPLPVRLPHELVALRRLSPEEVAVDFPYQAFQDLRRRTQSFQAIVARYRTPMRLRSDERLEWVTGVLASGDYFTVLGVQALHGRPLLSSDDRPGGGTDGLVAVISHHFWNRRFAGDPGVIGRSIALNGVTLEVAGVLEPGFSGLEVGVQADIWVPLSLESRLLSDGSGSMLTDPGAWWLELIGRLKRQVSIESAQSELSALYQQYRRDAEGSHASQDVLQEIHQETILLMDAREGMSVWIAHLETPLLMLGISTGLLLLIACANIANLLIARSWARKREMALRLALGIGRGRLIRQVLMECFLLALAGTGLALLFNYWGQVLIIKALASSSIAVSVPIDYRVLLFAGGLSLLATLLCGLLPALYAFRANLIQGLKSDFAGRTGKNALSAQRLLVAVQMAMAVLLLLVSGLMIRSFHNLTNQDLGFSAENVILFRINPSEAGFSGVKHQAFMSETLERIAALPGVAAVSFSRSSPLSGASSLRGGYRVEGRPERDSDPRWLELRAVGPGYFKTMGIKLLAGREIDHTDHHQAPRVAVINRHLAEIFGLDDSLGRILSAKPHGPQDRAQIIGQVVDAKYHSLREAKTPVIYIPYYQMPEEDWGPLTIEMRAADDALAVAPLVRQEIRAVGEPVAVDWARLMDNQIARTLATESLVTRLISLLALITLLLAALGLGGVLNHLTKRRTREIGIRMALGAERSSIVLLVVGEVVALVLIGGLLGLAGAWAATRLISNLLFEVSVGDPVAVALTLAILSLAAMAAGLVPARYAARLEPVETLKHD